MFFNKLFIKKMYNLIYWTKKISLPFFYSASEIVFI